MENEYLDKEKVLANQEKIVNKTKWACMCPDCKETAINSHLLQRHGILDAIAEEGHLYEVGIQDHFKWHKEMPMCFKKVGLQQAVSLPLFCSKHDTELFISIEQRAIDFDDYKSQLLFSYRGLCSEIRKKEFAKIRYACIKGDVVDQAVKGTDRGLKDLEYYKFLYEQEILKPQNKFTIYHLSYPLIPLYAIGSVSYDPVDYNNERSVDEILKKKVLDAFLINIIPRKDSLEILIGYHNNHANADLRKYVDSWKELSFEQLQIKLSDLLTRRLDTWGMSPSLYKSLSEEKKAKYFEYQMNEVFGSDDIRKELNYNLFDL